MGADAYSYEYGIGDELTRRIDQRTGELESVVSGADGRLLALDGETFGYDPAGRRTEDARFQYQWSWRGELVRLDVKEGAEEAWGSPYEGHMVRYAYDALGRLTSRTHWGPLPEGESDDSLRPFIERRDYVWDHQSRVAEIGSNDPEGAQVRWRKLYVPGPGGLDDAVQVVVQNVDGSEALYSILRDEIGSVIALVAEDETREGAGGTVDPTRPAIPVRYRYSPFGAALAETSPRVERLLFDNELVEVGGLQQADVPERDDAVAAAGALRVWFSAALDAATLGAGVVLESRTAGGAWTEVPAATPGGTEGLVLALDPETGTELRVLLVEGWRRGVAYRVRLRAELRDVLGRAPPASGPGGSASAAAPLQWTVPEGEGRAIAYEQRFASGERFESWAASGDTVGGRFPGGQNGLFHGLWTDPVSGISYARARWYDARTGSFLSEDPLRDVDSPNLYQYGLNSPFNYSDPMGECVLWWRRMKCGQKVTEWIEGSILRVDEGVAQDRGDADLLIAKFQREKGRAPLPHEQVAYDSASKRVLSGDGTWTSTKGQVVATHPEYVLVGGGVAGVRTFVARRAAGATLGESLGVGLGRATREVVDEFVPLDPAELLRRGRRGHQRKLRELAQDARTSAADRGWIRQELNEIAAGKRRRIRNPPGRELAHERGREAAKGYSYKHSNLQEQGLHKLQHRYDDFGRRNKERPVDSEDIDP
jgi:RHS repeat-associated protein